MVFRLCLHEIASSLGRHVIPTGCISSSEGHFLKIKYEHLLCEHIPRTRTHISYIKIKIYFLKYEYHILFLPTNFA